MYVCPHVRPHLSFGVVCGVELLNSPPPCSSEDCSTRTIEMTGPILIAFAAPRHLVLRLGVWGRVGGGGI